MSWDIHWTWWKDRVFVDIPEAIYSVIDGIGLSQAKSSDTQPNAYVKLVKNDGSGKSVDQLS